MKIHAYWSYRRFRVFLVFLSSPLSYPYLVWMLLTVGDIACGWVSRRKKVG